MSELLKKVKERNLKKDIGRGLLFLGVVGGNALAINVLSEVKSGSTEANRRVQVLEERVRENELVLCRMTLVNRPSTEEQDIEDCKNLVLDRDGVFK